MRVIHVTVSAVFGAVMMCAGPAATFDEQQKPKLAQQRFATMEKAPALQWKGSPPCYTGNPDATLTVEKSAEGYYSGHVKSRHAGYANDSNPYYTVEVRIPASYKSPFPDITGIKLYASLRDWLQLADSQEACPKASLVWAAFKRGTKNSNGLYSWSKVKGESKQGKWIPFVDNSLPPFCDSGVSLRINIPTAEGNASEDTFYRVMVLPKFNSTVRGAMVAWQWDY